MYGKACRFPTPPSTTPCFIGPDTYELEFQSCEPNKAHVPFLCGTTRKISWINPEQVKVPGPTSYNPETYVKRRVVGGKAPQLTEPRFTKSPWIPEDADTGPGPASYGKSNSPPFIKKKEKCPKPPCGNINCPGGEECLCRRSKGVMRKAPLRGPCDSVVPSIPKKGSKGYHQLNECGPWCPIPIIQPSLMPGPDSYDVSKVTCLCTEQYKGNFWSRMLCERKTAYETDRPGPAYYDAGVHPEWNALHHLHKEYERFRDFRRGNACKYRYPQTLINQTLKDNYPSATHYNIQDKNCCQIMEGVPFPPFLQGSARYEATQNDYPGPADCQWKIPDCLEKARRMTNCLEPPFLTTAERFKPPSCWTYPGPGDYETAKGIGDHDLCKRPEWDTLSPFGSSATRHTSYLIEDPCRPSPARYFKYPRSKERRVSYAVFKSATDRFPRPCDCDPDVGTYEAAAAKDALKARCEHRRPEACCWAPFLSGEERFGNVGDWPNKKVESDNPAPNAYDIVVNSVGNAKGGIMGLLDTKCRCPCVPGPGYYKVHPQYAESHVYHTFNAKLSNPLPRVVPELPKDSYAHRVGARKKLRCFVERVCPLVC